MAAVVGRFSLAEQPLAAGTIERHFDLAGSGSPATVMVCTSYLAAAPDRRSAGPLTTSRRCRAAIASNCRR